MNNIYYDFYRLLEGNLHVWPSLNPFNKIVNGDYYVCSLGHLSERSYQVESPDHERPSHRGRVECLG
jgi:hypothetical protein